MNAKASALNQPWDTAPAPGQAIEVAPGVLWLRMPLPMVLDHVNVYALDDGDGWTLIDTGLDTEKTRKIWADALAGPLKGKPVTRLLVTHHHPDHIGLAGWFQEQHGAELLTTRTAWLMARMLVLDEQDAVTPETLEFWRAAGMAEEIIAKRRAERPFNFADVVGNLPLGFRRIQEGETLTIGGRVWDIRMGNGHAPEHATLWSRDDGLVIGGVSPNIGVYATEPGADPLAEWLEACERLAQFARGDQLVLPGHKLPYTGLPFRLRQLVDNHHGALKRLREHLKTPQTAVDCFSVLFKRKIGATEYGLALVESVAHVNHLYSLGQLSRSKRADGAWLWQTKD